MITFKETFSILKKLIEKYCEEEEKNKLMEILILENGFPNKYIINEFSKLKIPSKMTKEELKDYEEKILIYIWNVSKLFMSKFWFQIKLKTNKYCNIV